MLSIKLNRVCLLILLCATALFWSCSSDDDENNPVGPNTSEDLTANCIGCHTNETLLKATMIPDEGSSGDASGEG